MYSEFTVRRSPLWIRLVLGLCRPRYVEDEGVRLIVKTFRGRVYVVSIFFMPDFHCPCV